MRRRSDGRVKAWVNGALAMVVVPLLATAGSGPVGGTPGQTATVGGPTATYAAMPSRSGPRIALLDHVDPETFLAEVGTDGEVRLSGPKGTRVWAASAMSDTGIPVAAERAYRRAAAAIATSDPECRLPWTLLAGVGRVESDHGRYDGSRLGSDGISRPRIIGVQLNGAGPVAAIRDTDAGKLDGDRIWDRAVGPMQFIPSTWSSARRDGDDDGRRDPHDLDDAAAATASYLCSGSGSMLDPGAQAAAIHRYNQDDYYVALVQAFEVGYRTGVFVMPPPPVEEDEVARKRRPKRRVVGGDGDGGTAGTITRTRLAPSPASSPTLGPATSPTASPTPKPSPKPSPSPSPTTSPAPAPATAPEPVKVEAMFTSCPGGYCLGARLLDLGTLGAGTATATGDFDRDATVETNDGEIAGLLDQIVAMVIVELPDGRFGILSINGVALG